jgi:hypothetical protein
MPRLRSADLDGIAAACGWTLRIVSASTAQAAGKVRTASAWRPSSKQIPTRFIRKPITVSLACAVERVASEARGEWTGRRSGRNLTERSEIGGTYPQGAVAKVESGRWLIQGASCTVPTHWKGSKC